MEPVGLALGALGVSGLFVSCIQNFNIVVQAKTFSKDFDLLCTELASLRLRLQTWGEAMGIASSPGEEPLPPSVILDRNDVSATFRNILLHLNSLLEEAGGVTDRYTNLDEAIPDSAGNSKALLRTSDGMDIFHDAFVNFQNRLKRAQKQTSAWKLIRWAVHDLDNFKDIIDKITRLLDSLEKVTESLHRGLIRRRQNDLMMQEVDTISDTRSLRLLQDLAMSTHASSASRRMISEAASTHLTHIVDSHLTGSSQSYRTAPTHPESQRSRSPRNTKSTNLRRPRTHAALSISSPNQQDLAALYPSGDQETASTTQDPPSLLTEAPQSLPSQNQLIMEQTLRKQDVPTPQLSFASGSATYGQAITEVKGGHDKIWENASTPLVIRANNGDELARRVFIELRSIRRAEIPFISVAPVDDRLDIILASIEGPPDTPYEKGIFWIIVRFNVDAPTEPPRLRFFTRVYHPNIDCEGQVCAHYPELADVSVSSSAAASLIKRPTSLHWFAGESPSRFYVGALLTALCNLLACPDIEDPLVLEIADTYVTDHNTFVQNARNYTQKYATQGKPDADAISGCIAAWDRRLEPGRSPTKPRSAQDDTTSHNAASTLIHIPDDKHTERSTLRSNRSQIEFEMDHEETVTWTLLSPAEKRRLNLETLKASETPKASKTRKASKTPKASLIPDAPDNEFSLDWSMVLSMEDYFQNR